jgi:hypothetical protein
MSFNSSAQARQVPLIRLTRWETPGRDHVDGVAARLVFLPSTSHVHDPHDRNRPRPCQPGVACYARSPGDDACSPSAIDVLRIVGGAVAELIAFDGSVFGWFRLPETL